MKYAAPNSDINLYIWLFPTLFCICFEAGRYAYSILIHASRCSLDFGSPDSVPERISRKTPTFDCFHRFGQFFFRTYVFRGSLRPTAFSLARGEWINDAFVEYFLLVFCFGVRKKVTKLSRCNHNNLIEVGVFL